jgi:hypothetical protein
MFLFRRINISVVLGSSIVIGVATVVSFWFAFGKDEGQLGTGYVENFIADSFYVFRFPTHVIFWELLNSSAILYFFGLILNCLFYGLLIERVWQLIKKQTIKV